jgi:hypothetical protein
VETHWVASSIAYSSSVPRRRPNAPSFLGKRDCGHRMRRPLRTARRCWYRARAVANGALAMIRCVYVRDPGLGVQRAAADVPRALVHLRDGSQLVRPQRRATAPQLTERGRPHDGRTLSHNFAPRNEVMAARLLQAGVVQQLHDQGLERGLVAQPHSVVADVVPDASDQLVLFHQDILRVEADAVDDLLHASALQGSAFDPITPCLLRSATSRHCAEQELCI